MLLELDRRGLRLAILGALTLPAAVLAYRRSPGFVVYVLFVFAFNRGLRRWMDFAEGGFQSRTVLSLLPLTVMLCAALPVALHFHKLPGRVRGAMVLFSLALAYALLLGAGRGPAAVIEVVQYLAPLLLLGYVLVVVPAASTADGWLRWLAVLAAVVAVYGWVQYLVMPAWDAMWMKGADMGSIGRPEPLEVRVFSTFASPGPAGMFLALALLPMMLDRRWRTPLGWLGVLVAASGLLLTSVRTSWLMLLVAVLAFAALGEGRQRTRALLGVVVVVAAAVFIAPFLPGGEVLANRISTLTSVGGDQSFHERLAFSQHILAEVLNHPQGFGLGSSGIAMKAAGAASGSDVMFDNGFLNLLYTFGVPGAAMLLFAAGGCWRCSSARGCGSRGVSAAARPAGRRRRRRSRRGPSRRATGSARDMAGLVYLFAAMAMVTDLKTARPFAPLTTGAGERDA